METEQLLEKIEQAIQVMEKILADGYPEAKIGAAKAIGKLIQVYSEIKR